MRPEVSCLLLLLLPVAKLPKLKLNEADPLLLLLLLLFSEELSEVNRLRRDRRL